MLHLFLALLPFPLQDDGCRRCEHLGVVPCKQHGKAEELERERSVLFCSFAADCEDCGGTLVVDCKRCDGGPGSLESAERAAAIAAWRERTEQEAHLDRDCRRVETERFALIVECGPVRNGKKRMDPHRLAHHLAEDVEAVATGVMEDFALTPEDQPSKIRMWIWRDLAEHKAILSEYFGGSGSGEAGFLGRDPRFSSWPQQPHFDEAAEVRSLFAHHATHLLLSNVLAERWIGDLGGGWLDAGAGHFYEYRLFDRTTNYCIEEATARDNYHDGLWRAAVRRTLAENEEPFLPRILGKRTGNMTQEEQALCWSFFDFVRREHRAALRPILEDYKRKREPREVLPDRLGASVLELDQRWRAWVEERYPKKGDEEREPRR